jgi:hypothetical protein
MLKPVMQGTHGSPAMVEAQVPLGAPSWFCAARFVLLPHRQES